jgi:hypothetical protein
MLKDLMKRKAELEEEIKALYEKHITPLQEQISAISIDIEHSVAGKLADLRQLQAKEYGVVHLVMDGYKISETVSKKVEWDQQKMNDLFDAIATAGDDPRAYMKLKLEVSEKAYADFVPEVKALFSDCRTITPGRPSLKFEEVASA